MFEEKVRELNNQPVDYGQQLTSMKRTYTVDEIVDILGISKTTAYHLVNSGEFHSVRIGGQHRISKKSFDGWLDGKEV